MADQIVSGRFDTDDNADLFWSVGARRGTTFEVAYSRDEGPSPLEALSAAQTLGITSLQAADLTGDGYDDIIVTGAGVVNQAVSVVPVHVKSPIQTLTTDDTCGP